MEYQSCEDNGYANVFDVSIHDLNRDLCRFLVYNTIYQTNVDYYSLLENLNNSYIMKINELNYLTINQFNGMFLDIKHIYESETNMIQLLETAHTHSFDPILSNEILNSFIEIIPIYTSYIKNYSTMLSIFDSLFLQHGNSNVVQLIHDIDNTISSVPLRILLCEPYYYLKQMHSLILELNTIELTDEENDNKQKLCHEFDILYQLILEQNLIIAQNKKESNNMVTNPKSSTLSTYSTSNNFIPSVTTSTTTAKQTDIHISNTDTSISTTSTYNIYVDIPELKSLEKIREDIMIKLGRFNSQKYFFILYPNYILYCNTRKTTKYSLIRYTNVELLTFSMPYYPTNYPFIVYSDTKSLLICAPSQEIRNLWISNIQNMLYSSPSFLSFSAPVLTYNPYITKCEKCYTPFTFLRKKHFCENCGMFICVKCIAGKLYAPFSSGLLIICSQCYNKLLPLQTQIRNYLKDKNEDESKTLLYPELALLQKIIPYNTIHTYENQFDNPEFLTFTKESKSD